MKPFAFALFPMLAAGAVTLAPVGEFPVQPERDGGVPPSGLSGLTRADGDLYYAVKDAGGWVYPLTIGVDRVTGAVTNCAPGARFLLDPVRARKRYMDLEDCAWDAARRVLWVADEYDGTVWGRAADGAAAELSAPVPAVFDAFRFNRSLESLTLRANGLEMWTCNEEALCRREAADRGKRREARPVTIAPDVDDGPRATRTNGSRVRLQKFTRAAPDSPWEQAGQWTYETDPVGGASFIGKSQCGVSGLLVLDDGSLLVLERELSVKSKVMVPSFRCRIYAVDFAGATETSALLSVSGPDVKPVAKKRVFGANTGFAMYEGICLGPALADGARSVLLVSDGDDGAVVRLYALRLSL